MKTRIAYLLLFTSVFFCLYSQEDKAVLTLRSNPQGAAVYSEDMDEPLGITPFVRDVDPGIYHLTLKKEFYNDQKIDLEIAEGKRYSKIIEMEADFLELNIVLGSSMSANVSLNGDVIGRTPFLDKIPFEDCSLTLDFTDARYRSWHRDIKADTRGETIFIEPEFIMKSAFVTVIPDPPVEGRLYIDGEQKTLGESFQLKAGTHIFEIEGRSGETLLYGRKSCIIKDEEDVEILVAMGDNKHEDELLQWQSVLARLDEKSCLKSDADEFLDIIIQLMTLAEEWKTLDFIPGSMKQERDILEKKTAARLLDESRELLVEKQNGSPSDIENVKYYSDYLYSWSKDTLLEDKELKNEISGFQKELLIVYLDARIRDNDVQIEERKVDNLSVKNLAFFLTGGVLGAGSLFSGYQTYTQTLAFSGALTTKQAQSIKDSGVLWETASISTFLLSSVSLYLGIRNLFESGAVNLLQEENEFLGSEKIKIVSGDETAIANWTGKKIDVEDTSFGIADSDSSGGETISEMIDIEEELAEIHEGRLDMVKILSTGKTREINIQGRPIILDRGFSISRYEITQGLYQKITGENPSLFKGVYNPVERINWYEAIVFCNLLSQQEGRIPCYYTDSGFSEVFESGQPDFVYWNENANGYRLPTEAEWEAAAAEGNNGLGDSLEKRSWYKANSRKTTHPAGIKEADSLGLYDISGNVAEWCWDDWTDIYTAEDDNVNSLDAMKAARGGGWNSSLHDCTYIARSKNDPGSRFSRIGLRVVTSP